MFFFQSDANVDHMDNEGWTALRSAAWGGHSEVVSLLLKASAKVRVGGTIEPVMVNEFDVLMFKIREM